MLCCLPPSTSRNYPRILDYSNLTRVKRSWTRKIAVRKMARLHTRPLACNAPASRDAKMAVGRVMSSTIPRGVDFRGGDRFATVKNFAWKRARPPAACGSSHALGLGARIQPGPVLSSARGMRERVLSYRLIGSRTWTATVTPLLVNGKSEVDYPRENSKRLPQCQGRETRSFTEETLDFNTLKEP